MEQRKNWQAADESIVVVMHDQNSGYGSALNSGIRHAKSNLITEADGTYPKERIVELGENYDVVIGSRTAPDLQYSKIRKIFLKAYTS